MAHTEHTERSEQRDTERSEQRDTERSEQRDTERSEPGNHAPSEQEDDPLVCHCMKVRLSTLRALLEAEGAPAELATLMETTRAGTGCGTCRSDLMGLLSSTRRGENA